MQAHLTLLKGALGRLVLGVEPIFFKFVDRQILAAAVVTIIWIENKLDTPSKMSVAILLTWLIVRLAELAQLVELLPRRCLQRLRFCRFRLFA